VAKQALGRGLDAILGGGRAERGGDVGRDGDSATGAPLMVAIEKVTAGRGQPRRLFADETLDELAASIREKGILQPLVVTPTPGGFELIAGERRLRAAARAGLDQVPVVVRHGVDSEQLLELALIENIQREDLTALEQARAYQRLIDQYGYTQEQAATRVGKSRAAVANSIRLLGLPEPVRETLEAGLLTEGHARALLGLPTSALQISTARTVVRKALSVRGTEEMVKSLTANNGNGNRQRSTKGVRTSSAELRAVEDGLTRTLGTKVRIKGSTQRGRIELDYYSQAELTRLVDRLGK
jgi:ParB family chromosome partitioning protein